MSEAEAVAEVAEVAEVEEEQSFEEAFEELSSESEKPSDDYELAEETQADESIAVEPAQEESEQELQDIWANSTDEQRAAYEQVQNEAQNWSHKYRSDEGRVSALQRQVNELTAAKSQAAPTPPEAFTGEKWKEIDEEYPEIAGGINERFDAIQAQHQAELNAMRGQVSSMLDPILAQQKEREKRVELDKLAAEHPDWQQVAQSQEFTGWLNGQPAQVQSLYGSNSAADAGYLVQTYKDATGITAPAAVSPQANTVQAKREKQLRESTGISGRKTAARSIPKDDFEGSFEFYARQDEARRASR
jgi:hypothetical protein